MRPVDYELINKLIAESNDVSKIDKTIENYIKIARHLIFIGKSDEEIYSEFAARGIDRGEANLYLQSAKVLGNK